MNRSFDTLRMGVVVTVLVAVILLLQQFTAWRPASALPAWTVATLAVLAVALVVLGRGAARLRVAIGVASVALLSASLVIVNSGRETSPEARWREHDARQIASVLISVGERIDALQTLSTTIGEEVHQFLATHPVDNDDALGWRLDLFRMLDGEATRVTGGGQLPQGTEIGIQLLSADGDRIAWAGWPQSLNATDAQLIARGDEVFYTRQVSLYQILTHVIPMPGGSDGTPIATVVVDLPLEVNYRVNNRFLKSTSIGQEFAAAAAAEVRFDYFASAEKLLRPSQDIRPIGAPDSSLVKYGFPQYVKPLGRITGDAQLGLVGRATIVSRLDNQLMGISVNSRPMRHYTDGQSNRADAIAKALFIIAFLILFGGSLRHFPTRLAGPIDAFKALYFAVLIVGLRYLLLAFQPSHLIFDPAIFATPILGGVMRSAGDLLVTAVMFVGALYGVLKITRDATRRTGTTSSPVRWLFVFKAIFAATILIGAVDLSRRFVSSIVVNANPRLVGETMRLTETQTLILHLSAFLMIAGIMLGGLILTWGVYRLRGRGDATRASVVAGIVLALIVPFVWGWQVTVAGLLLLLFLVFAPRVVKREDLVSIVIVTFAFVIIVSGASYTFLNEDYQNLRRTFIQEKVTELTHPADNWKVFILEDVLETFAQDVSIRQTLRAGEPTEVQRLSFDLWAGSSLSLLGYSSAIHVFDDTDSLVSRFSVEMPYRVRLTDTGQRLETSSSQQWVVLDLTTNTPQGTVRFYRGIVNLSDYVVMRDGIPQRSLSGKIVVDIPFHFENLNWAARTGPQTPEVLRNVQEGGITPRVEETEALLLARARGSRVLESSSDILPVGFRFPESVFERAVELDWPLLKTNGPTYRFFVQELEDSDTYLLAGFPVPSPVQHVLRWSTILSLYFFFTAGILALIVLLNSIPVLGWALPSVTPGRQLGFQQKLLGSFLIVALIPAVFLGVFSMRMIKQRFEAESRKEAIYKSYGAYKSISNLVVGEMDYLFDHTDLQDSTLR